jgi:hypothetical protein
MTGLNVARLSCSGVEKLICELWRDCFGREVSPYDDFYDLGGDSFAMIDVVARARERGLPVRTSVALRCSTPAQLAEHLTVHADACPPVWIPALAANTTEPVAVAASPVGIGPTSEGTSLYVVHSDSHVRAERDAIDSWRSGRPVHGFRLLDARRPAGEIANEFLAAMDQHRGPYQLVGFGSGAVVAYEMAGRLRDGGAEVALLALIKPSVAEPAVDRDELLGRRLGMLARRFGLTADETIEQIHARMCADGWYDDVHPLALPRLQRLWVDLTMAEVAGYAGPAILLQDLADSRATEMKWRHAAGNLETHWFDYGIESPLAMLRDARLGQTMRRALSA